MSLARNSAPFAFRSFGRVAPTTEQLRQELEKSFNYTQERLNSLAFGNVRGSLVESQSPFVTAGFSSIRTELVDGDSANAERIDTLSATILNPRTGLAQAHARITLAQTVQVTANSALASQVSTVLAQVGDAQASVTEERVARVDADGAVTASLTTEVAARISGDTTLAASVTTEATARITADGVVTASLATEVASRISGDTAIAATVTTEATTRATADGNVSGKYTLDVTVSAGGVKVVTGLNLTSSINSGVTTSTVVFQASDFQIWNNSTDAGVNMFDISGSLVRLAGTLVVSTSGKVYIGTGTFNNANTAFFVDSTGQFSLKDKLSWDLSTLSVNGSITSASGTIGGFTLAATSLSATGILADASSPLFRIGTAAAERAEMQVVSARARFAVYNSTGTLTGRMQGNDGLGYDGGLFELADATGVATIQAVGNGGRLYVGDGTVGSPGYAFNSDSDTGMYRSATNELSFSTGGTKRGSFLSTGRFDLFGAVTVAGTASFCTSTTTLLASGGDLSGAGKFWMGDGSAAVPTFSFLNDTDTGIFRFGTDDIRITTGGVQRFVVQNTQIVCLQPLKLDNPKVASSPVAGGTVTMLDSTGATIQVLVV